MINVKQFDNVLLRDSREGCVVDAFEDDDIYYVDVGSSPEDWENITASRTDIVKVVQRA